MADEYYVLVLKGKTQFREVVNRKTVISYLEAGILLTCKLKSETDRENLEEIKKRQKVVEAFHKLGDVLDIIGE